MREAESEILARTLSYLVKAGVVDADLAGSAPAASDKTGVAPSNHGPRRQMTDQHRKNLSKAVRRMWASKRLRTSISEEKLRAVTGPMRDALRQKYPAAARPAA
jgi:hypothetical protein